jgi:Icc-related predicted phosphoesterase
MVMSIALMSACATTPPPPDAGVPLDELDPLPPSAAAESPSSASQEDDRAVVEQSIGRRTSAPEAVEPEETRMSAEQVVEAVQEEVSGQASWLAYQTEQRFECVGALTTLETPYSFRSGDANVTLDGWRGVVERQGDPKRAVRIGVLSAIKDKYPDTLMNLTQFIKWFESEGVDAIVLNGDISYESDDIAVILEHVARSSRPVWVIPGNADPVAGFNLALRQLSTRFPNLISGSFVRLLQIGDVALVSLPGYYDPRFIAGGGGCQYYGDDVKLVAEIVRRSKGTPVLVSHGPPKGTHPNDLDYAFDAGNVGDARLNMVMKTASIRLGIFGHILESGGRVLRGVNGKTVDTGKWSNRLWVNAGSVSSVEQDLHDGASHQGMAAIVEIDPSKRRGRVSFQFRRP